MSSDTAYKYECAKQYFAMGKFNQASQLLQDVVIGQKGRSTAQESLYMLALAEYNNRDYESASQTFKKYFSSYPKGDYAEQACFYIGRSLFESVPEPRLDQTPTVSLPSCTITSAAISATSTPIPSLTTRRASSPPRMR